MNAGLAYAHWPNSVLAPLLRQMSQVPANAPRCIAMKPTSAVFLLLAALLSLASTAQDKCTAQGQAEQRRIEQEFSAQRPAKGDKAAEQVWSKNLQASLAAAAKQAEECTRANTPKPSPAATAKVDECLAGVRRRGDELQQRYKGRTLTPQEQTALRGEEQRLHDEYMSCTRPKSP